MDATSGGDEGAQAKETEKEEVKMSRELAVQIEGIL